MNWELILKGLREKRTALVESFKTAATQADLDKIELDLRKLDFEIKDAEDHVEEEKRSAQATQQPQGTESARTQAVNGTEGNGVESRAFNQATNFTPVAGANFEKRTEDTIDYEKRGKDLIEKRAVSMSSGTIIAPQHQATDIKGTFNQVSSLIDGVTVKPLNGGESYKRPYIKGYGTGDYTAEGGTPPTTETQFGYADISKAKITAYAEDTEEVEKLPAAQYAMECEKGVRIALRKKATAEILVGDGSTNHLMGIFNTDVIQAETDITVSAIDNKTLDEIIFSFGGDEDVEDAAVLILNKKDLKAFSQLRSDVGEKIHTIVSKGNSGTIDGVPYIINSKCKAISDATTTSGEYCMAYGPLSNYELAIFGDIEVKKSTEYKFKEGMLAHRGVVFMGGNVAAHNGFLRIKK